jgi:hypothetical protein
VNAFLSPLFHLGIVILMTVILMTVILMTVILMTVMHDGDREPILGLGHD